MVPERMKTCPTCNGSGKAPPPVQDIPPGGAPMSPNYPDVPCGTCGGTGRVKTDDPPDA